MANIKISNVKSNRNLSNGQLTKNNKPYVRKTDYTRYSNKQLVDALFSKKWNSKMTRGIREIKKLIALRIKNGKCTQYEIDNLVYLTNIKKYKIIKSIKSNSKTTTIHTTIPACNNLAVSMKFRTNKLIDEIYRLTGLKLEKLNRTDNVDDKAHVFDDQIFASLTCIHTMLLSKNSSRYSRYNMLTAETQAGKTGVVRNIIYLLETYKELRDYLNINFGRSLLITPMCDNANKEQLKIDISHGECRQDNQRLLKRNGIMHNPDLIHWSRKNKSGNLNNCIIFIDEAHLASNVNSAMNSFLQKNGINLNGSTNLSKKNIFLFTVSATPYEEHVGNILYKKKNTIELSHGPNYKGLEHFLKNNLLRESFDLSTPEGEDNFKFEAESFNHKIGYYIVRINRNTETDNLIPEGFSTLTYYEKDREVINDILKVVPEKPTLIFIKDKMKQSYQLEKSNIVMLFDRTTKNDSKYRTSFIVQSFAGRSCGYHNYNFIIYTEIKHVKQHLDYLKNKYHVPSCKHITKNNKYHFVKTKNQQSSYSSQNNQSYINNFPIKSVLYQSIEGYIKLNDDIIKIYLDRNKNLVLSKHSRVNTEYLQSYIENNIVHTDIEIPCKSFKDAKNVLIYYCQIISSSKKIDEVKTKNGHNFIDLLKLEF